MSWKKGEGFFLSIVSTCMFISLSFFFPLSNLSSTNRSDAFYRETRFQLKRPTSLHLLIPQLYCSALFSPAEHTHQITHQITHNSHYVLILVYLAVDALLSLIITIKLK